MREFADGRRIAEYNIHALETTVALDKDLLGSIHEHVGHAGVV